MHQLKQASAARLACLSRHWTWADEALARFDRELAEGWENDDDPIADRPFGAYYQWCALLCSLSEAALHRGLLTEAEFDAASCWSRSRVHSSPIRTSSRFSATTHGSTGCGVFTWRLEMRFARSTWPVSSRRWTPTDRRRYERSPQTV
jgi:hypothetical protein